MSRRLSKRVVLAATSTLLLLLYIAATTSNNKALLSTYPGKSLSPQEGPAADKAKAAGNSGGEAGGGWPESWGREIGFRPGVRLPNVGRTPGKRDR